MLSKNGGVGGLWGEGGAGIIFHCRDYAQVNMLHSLKLLLCILSLQSTTTPESLHATFGWQTTLDAATLLLSVQPTAPVPCLSP